MKMACTWMSFSLHQIFKTCEMSAVVGCDRKLSDRCHGRICQLDNNCIDFMTLSLKVPRSGRLRFVWHVIHSWFSKIQNDMSMLPGPARFIPNLARRSSPVSFLVQHRHPPEICRCRHKFFNGRKWGKTIISYRPMAGRSTPVLFPMRHSHLAST